MRERPKHVRPRTRPPEDAEEPPRTTPNRGAMLVETPRALTWSQQMRKGWNERVPRTQEVNNLFIPTGRHQVRLDWRHRLAIPFVAMIVVFSPLLLIWAALSWMAGKVEAIRRARKTRRSDGA